MKAGPHRFNAFAETLEFLGELLPVAHGPDARELVRRDPAAEGQGAVAGRQQSGDAHQLPVAHLIAEHLVVKLEILDVRVPDGENLIRIVPHQG